MFHFRTKAFLQILTLISSFIFIFSPLTQGFAQDVHTGNENGIITLEPQEIPPHAVSEEAYNITIPRIEMFGREDCKHCQDEKAFLQELSKSQEFIFVYHDIQNFNIYDEFQHVTDSFKIMKATPLTLIGNTLFSGFSDANTTGKAMEETLKNSKEFYRFQDVAQNQSKFTVYGNSGAVCDDTGCSLEDIHPLANVHVPFVGNMDLRPYSLPVLAGILGLIDGFNPCAMWVLVMLLIALLQLGDKTKMIFAAGTFILAETVMYTLILSVWLTTWNFIGFERYVTPIVGVIAVGAGLFFLYEGIFSDGTCKVTNVQQRKKISERIKELAQSPFSWGFFVSMLFLAFSVNIIEFACSIGIPQTFTQIIHLSNINLLQEIGLIALYILFYMIDDFVVFGLALWSVEKIGITHKYARTSNVIGGTLMLILGLLLLVKPELLAL